MTATLEEKYRILEENLRVMAQVSAATTDDLLRVCFVLQELEQAGYLPTLPWELGAALVDLQHAQQHQANKEPLKNGLPTEVVIKELQTRVRILREQFRDHAHEQEL